MAIHTAVNRKIWFDGYDLTGETNAIALDLSSELQDADTFGNAAKTRLAGLKDVTLSVEGLYDAEGADQTLFNNIGAENKLISFAGSDSAIAIGDVVYFLQSTKGGYSPGAATGETFRYTLTGSISGGDSLIRGTLMENQSGVSSSSNGTTRNIGATSAAQTLYAGIHVLAVDNPADTLDVTIESDSADNFTGSETTRITFSQFSATGSEYKTQAGAITDTWYRVTWTVAGSTPSFDFVVALGIL